MTDLGLFESHKNLDRTLEGARCAPLWELTTTRSLVGAMMQDAKAGEFIHDHSHCVLRPCSSLIGLTIRMRWNCSCYFRRNDSEREGQGNRERFALHVAGARGDPSEKVCPWSIVVNFSRRIVLEDASMGSQR